MKSPGQDLPAGFRARRCHALSGIGAGFAPAKAASSRSSASKAPCDPREAGRPRRPLAQMRNAGSETAGPGPAGRGSHAPASPAWWEPVTLRGHGRLAPLRPGLAVGRGDACGRSGSPLARRSLSRPGARGACGRLAGATGAWGGGRKEAEAPGV